jgi:hypothetical protein
LFTVVGLSGSGPDAGEMGESKFCFGFDMVFQIQVWYFSVSPGE